MSKKIIAVALAIVMIAVMFTACSKKLRVEKIQGKDHAVMTDKDGNVIVDENNRVQAIVTDNAGEVVTFENGEPQTYWVPITNYFVADGKLYTPIYTLASIKGWEMNASGAMEKDGSEGKCKITVAKVLTKDYEDATLDEYLKFKEEQDKAATPEFEKQGYKISYTKETVSLTEDNIQMISYKVIIYNKDGSIANYAETLFFQLNRSDKYSIHYASESGVGYDEKFDFRAFINENFDLVKTDK